MKPNFRPGKNIAMKVPSHEYADTVAFYRDVLEMQQIVEQVSSSTESVRFNFGDKILWIDKVPSLSQAEIWLEVITDDIENSAEYLVKHSCIRRDDIENLPNDINGFWISNPSNIIHLVTDSDIT